MSEDYDTDDNNNNDELEEIEIEEYQKDIEVEYGYEECTDNNIINSNESETNIEQDSKRKLTQDEIIDILSFLDKECINEIVSYTIDRIRIDLKNQLENILIYPNNIPELKKTLEKEFQITRIQPGEMVGVSSAISIGETSTQSTLNTFHYAGCSIFGSVTMGITRLNELLNISKNQKRNIMKIQMKKGYIDESKSEEEQLSLLRNKTRQIFEERFVENFTKEYNIYYRLFDNLSDNDKIWYENFKLLYNSEFEKYEWSIRLYINKLYMLSYKMTLFDISRIIESEYEDCYCVFSPDHLSVIDVYFDTSGVTEPSLIKEKLKKNKTNDKNTSFINDENKNFYYIRDVALQNLMSIQLCGIDNIKRLYFRKANKEKECIWCIESDGSNFRDVLNNENVDYKNTLTNNIWEIYETLGIEAARSFLISELRLNISSSVDKTHLELLADSMTFNGLTPVSRYGISRNIAGPLTKSSFEQAFDNILIATKQGETDNMKNISSSIIMGKFAPIGTGIFDTIIDMKFLEEQEKIKEQKILKKKTTGIIDFNEDDD